MYTVTLYSMTNKELSQTTSVLLEGRPLVGWLSQGTQWPREGWIGIAGQLCMAERERPSSGCILATSNLRVQVIYSPSHLNFTGWSSMTSWFWGLLSNLGNVDSLWLSVGEFLGTIFLPRASWLPRPGCWEGRVAGQRAAGLFLSSSAGGVLGALASGWTLVACRVMVLETL